MPSPPKVAAPNAETNHRPSLTFESPARQKASWTKPALVVYGDVRQLTMGISPGLGESGNEQTRHS